MLAPDTKICCDVVNGTTGELNQNASIIKIKNEYFERYRSWILT